jgi:bacteriorhodopsin
VFNAYSTRAYLSFIVQQALAIICSLFNEVGENIYRKYAYFTISCTKLAGWFGERVGL